MQQLAKDYEALYQSQTALRASQMAKIRSRVEVRQGLMPLGDLLREVLKPGQKISLVAMASLLKSLKPVTDIAEYMKAELKLEEKARLKPMEEEDRVSIEDIIGTPRSDARTQVDRASMPGTDPGGATDPGSEAAAAWETPTNIGPSTVAAGMSEEMRTTIGDLNALLMSGVAQAFRADNNTTRAFAKLDTALDKKDSTAKELFVQWLFNDPRLNDSKNKGLIVRGAESKYKLKDDDKQKELANIFRAAGLQSVEYT